MITDYAKAKVILIPDGAKLERKRNGDRRDDKYYVKRIHCSSMHGRPEATAAAPNR